jgi:hypothetical protein
LSTNPAPPDVEHGAASFAPTGSPISGGVMPNPGLQFTATMSIHLLTLDALKALTAPELSWRPLAQVTRNEPGPFVYVLSDGLVVTYPGKSDAIDGDGAKRAAAYPRWIAEYMSAVADGGEPDPMFAPFVGNLDLCDWSGIVRLAARYNLSPLVASVAHTNETGAVWEARLKALGGILSGLESLGGGSVWERKPNTLRYFAYDWAVQRLEAFRRN